MVMTRQDALTQADRTVDTFWLVAANLILPKPTFELLNYRANGDLIDSTTHKTLDTLHFDLACCFLLAEPGETARIKHNDIFWRVRIRGSMVL